jgi:anti-anti-sigma regulatory factor
MALDEQMENVYKNIKISDLIIDCSCINYIDSMGIDAIIKVKFHASLIIYKFKSYQKLYQ